MTRTVDVLEGNTFVVSDERGDIDGSPVEAHGLFDRDTRYLSRWILTLDGERLSTLSVDRTRYYAAQFFLAPGVASAYINAKVAVIRQRTVLGGFHEVISITNHDAVPVTLEVSLAADADFADLFEVKDAVHEKQGRTYRRTDPDRLVLGYEREKYRRETWIRAGADPVYDEAGLRFTITLAPQQAWSTEIDVLTVRNERTRTGSRTSRSGTTRSSGSDCGCCNATSPCWSAAGARWRRSTASPSRTWRRCASTSRSARATTCPRPGCLGSWRRSGGTA